MKTNVSRKTINTYIYLKKAHILKNKSADNQVHMMKASTTTKATVVFMHFFIY